MQIFYIPTLCLIIYVLSVLAACDALNFLLRPIFYQKPSTVFVSTPPPPPALPQLSPNLHNTLKIFAGLSKHLPVFLLGTENVVEGWVAIVVVVCGKICGKMCGKICGKIEKLSD